jgi:hypothetical protein
LSKELKVAATPALNVSSPVVLVVPAEPTKTPETSTPVVSGQVITQDKLLILKDFL